MAISLLSYDVSDLCLGKPPLRSLSISATVEDALAVLKTSDDNFISVWSCGHTSPVDFDGDGDYCRCVGKVCTVDLICYLCKEDSLSSPSRALTANLSVLLPSSGLVKHVEPSLSLLEAIDLIVNGAHNLVVPIKSNSRKKARQIASSPSTIHNGREYCWITSEDVIRFLLSSIGVFSPVPALSIDTLGVINTQFLAVNYHSPASSAVDFIAQSNINHTSVAVVAENGILIGEVSPENIFRLVKMELKDRNLEGILEQFESSSFSYMKERRVEAIVSYPWSSLMAVMIQAIAHRVNYVWVVEDDCKLVGIVTFGDMLKVFREHLHGSIEDEDLQVKF